MEIYLIIYVELNIFNSRIFNSTYIDKRIWYNVSVYDVVVYLFIWYNKKIMVYNFRE